MAGEKEPDVRFRARASTASVPMEIKVAENWTLAALEEALTGQLVGRYLRDQHNRWEILLLIHQKPRRQGWRGPGRDRLSIGQVVQHLRAVASRIAAAQPAAPQPVVELVDVSAASQAATPRARARKQAMKPSRGRSVRAHITARKRTSKAKPNRKRGPRSAPALRKAKRGRSGG